MSVQSGANRSGSEGSECPTLQECGGDRRRQILEITLKLFGERGVERTTIKQIAEAAGMSPGLLYHYFSGKEKLLEEVMDYRALDLPCLEEMHDRPAAEVIPLFAHSLSRDLRENIDVIWIFFRESHTSPAVAQQIERRRQSCLNSLSSYLEVRQAKGELRSFPVKVASQTLLAALFNLHLRDQPDDDFIDAVVDLYLKGIRA